jgi:hypothetical protein
MLDRRVLACLAAALATGGLLAPGLPLGPSTAAGQDTPPAGDEPPPAGDAPPPAGDAPPPAGDEPAGDDEPADDGPRRRPRRVDADRRQLDTDSPVARKLDELLVVDPRYATDGTVELVYDFSDDGQVADWEVQGLDRVEEANRRGNRGRAVARGAKKPVALSLGAGGAPGLFAHKLELVGQYEVEVRCHVERTTTRSALVFMLGKGGASWGSQLVQRGSSGFSVVGREAPDKDAWAGGRVVTVTVSANSGELVTSLNGARVEATKRLEGKLDGRAAIYLTDMHLVVHRVVIRGTVNPNKL